MVNKTVLLEPMYTVKWESNWPILSNSDLLKLKKIKFTSQSMNKKDIKLKAVHSLVHDIKKPHIAHIARSSHNTNISEVSGYTFPNLEILEICPTLQNSVQYDQQGSFGSLDTEYVLKESNSQQGSFGSLGTEYVLKESNSQTLAQASSS